MKILFLASRIDPNKTSCGLLANKILLAFSKAHQVDLITEEEYFLENLNPKSYSFKFHKGYKNTFITKIVNSLIKLSTQKHFLGYLVLKSFAITSYLLGFNFITITQLLFWKIKIKEALSKNNYDLIFCYGSGNDFNPHYATYFIKSKVPFIANFHDPFPGHLFPIPYRQPKNRINTLNFKLMKKVLNKSFKITSPSILLNQDIIKYYQVEQSKLVYLPHIDGDIIGQNKSDINSQEKISLQKEKFNILHAGTLLDGRNPQYLINAFQQFINEDKEKKEKANLFFVGYLGKSHQHYINENMEKHNIIIKPYRISYEKSIELLKSATVNLILEAESDESIFMPGKITDYIKAQRPILALTPKISEVGRLLGDNYPYKCEVNNTTEILNKLNSLWFSWMEQKLENFQRKDLNSIISSDFVIDKINKIGDSFKLHS